MSSQTNSKEILTIEKIITNLSNLLPRLSIPQGSSSNNGTDDIMHIQFEKPRRDFNQIKKAFEILQKFEDGAGGKINELERSLDDIRKVPNNDLSIVESKLSAFKDDAMKLKMEFSLCLHKMSSQTNSIEILTIEKIITNLSNLLPRLSIPQGSGSNNGTDDIRHIQFEKLRRDFNQIKKAFEILQKFEDGAGGKINELERSLDDISRKVEDAPKNDLSIVESKLSAFKDDAMKLKMEFPLCLHKMSSTNVHRYSRPRNWSESDSEVDELRSLHGSHKILSSSVFTEFQEVFEDLDTRLKACCLSFAVLPANVVVKRRLLINWWVGERLVDPPATGKKTAEDIADEILTELEVKGFIEAVEERHKKVPDRFKMQPRVHRVVILLAQGAQLLYYDSNGNPTVNSSVCNRACLVKAEDGTSEQVSAPNLLDLEKLQTIFNVNEPFPDLRFARSAKMKNVSIVEWFSKMKKLNVLYLGRWQSSDQDHIDGQSSDQHHVEEQSSDQDHIVWPSSLKNHIEVESREFLKGLKNMKCLRLLSLQGISRINELPNSIGKLTDLRILDLKACHNLEALPDGIGSLKKLSHLDISGCYLLDDMPKGLTSLSELQVLKGFVIGNLERNRDNNYQGQQKLGGLCFPQNRGSCNLKDLIGLKKLSKLSINTRSKAFPTKEELKVLRKLEALRKLAIVWSVNSTQQENGVISSVGDETSDNGREDSVAAQPTRAPSRVPSSAGAVSSDNGRQDSGAAQPTRAPSRVLSSAGAVSSDNGRQDSGAAQPTRTPSRVLSSAGAMSSDNGRQDSGAAQPTRAPSRVLSLVGAVSSDRGCQDSGAAQPHPETLGLPINLEKLELQSFPDDSDTPKHYWLTQGKLKRLEKLYIRGGKLKNLGQMQQGDDKWTVEILRLKYLDEFYMDWDELQTLFPKLTFLEMVECRKLSSWSCDRD